MVRTGLILLVLTLIGCSTPAAFTPGVVVQPPSGWVGYCTRHPMDPDCKGTTK
jgi:hypothetical protein